MKILESGAVYSKISAIGEKVKRLEKEKGEKYLYLYQGVNSVVPIDLTEVIKQIDFNSRDIQVYAPMTGRPKLKEAINNEYFGSKTKTENILVCNGGMSGLDMVFQLLDIQKVFVPSYFWGSYFNILKVRKIEGYFYENFQELEENPEKYKNNAVIICDPNNPLGDKYDDERLLNLIKALNNEGCIVIIDSPYRKVFLNNDKFFEKLYSLSNVIIIESFSKSLGLSGQRIGFVHSVNEKLMEELAIRLMYASNGVNGFSQLLVEKLFTTKEGRKAISDFKEKTTDDIEKNINYLNQRGFLAKEFYQSSKPMGIFVVVNLAEDELMKARIASVSLSFFTRKYKEKASVFSRICVSVPHEELKSFFDFLDCTH